MGRFVRESCVRLLEVARGLPVPLCASIGTPVLGGAILPGIVCSRIFGVLTGKNI